MSEDSQPPTDDLSRAAFLRDVARGSGVASGAFALGVAVDALWARLVRGWRLDRADYPRLVVGGFRVHHNLVGYAALVVGLFAHPLVLVPLGLGMIVGHRRRDRLLWFLERTGR